MYLGGNMKKENFSRNSELDDFCKEQSNNSVSKLVLYRPYRNFLWIAFFMFLLFVMLLILNFFIHDIALLLMRSFHFLLALYAYNEYSKIIAFSQTEIQVLGHAVLKRCLWTDFQYSYLGRSFKGFPYLILSAEPLEEKRIRSLCNKSCLSFTFTICCDDFLVIPIDEHFKVEVRKIIDVHVENFKDYT